MKKLFTLILTGALTASVLLPNKVDAADSTIAVMNAGSGLAFVSVTIGYPSTVSSGDGINKGKLGWTALALHAVEAVALDAESGNLKFNEISAEQGRYFNLNLQDVDSFNSERTKINDFVQSVHERLPQKEITQRKLADDIARTFKENFSRGSYNVIAALAQIALRPER